MWWLYNNLQWKKKYIVMRDKTEGGQKDILKIQKE